MNKPKPIQFSVKALLVILTGVAILLGVIRYQRSRQRHNRLVEEVEQLKQDNQDLTYRLLLQEIGSNMRIPTAALNHRYMPIQELNRLRTEGLRSAGAEYCVPIFYLQGHTISGPQSWIHNSNAYRIEDRDPSRGTYWEGYAEGRAGNAPSVLSAYLRGTPEFRTWLSDHPDLVREYLRPLLLRIADAPDPRGRYDAIEAMLLLDDQPGHILQILKRSIERPDKEPAGLTEIERKHFHDVDPVRAQELINEFELDIRVD